MALELQPLSLVQNIKIFELCWQPQTERVYSSYLELDLDEVEPSMSGPKRYSLDSALIGQ